MKSIRRICAYRISLTIGLCVLINTALFATTRATVDRTQLGPGETLTLTLTSDDFNAAAPNLKVLQKDFQILGSSQSSSINIINGSQTSTKSFQIELMPRHPGTLIIPSLPFKNGQTKPITVTVTKTIAPSPYNRLTRGLSITASLDHPQTYVGAQVLYTLQIQSAITINNANVVPPALDGASLKQFGRDRSFQRVINGQLVDVVQRQYLISSDHAATLQIDPATLIAYVPDNRPQSNNNFFNSPFGSFPGFSRPSRRVTVQSKPLSLRILPAKSSSNWLPAYQLKLKQSWGKQSQPSLKVGTPITRRIEIVAQGIDSAKLPVITLDSIPGVNIYPDQQQYKNTVQGQTPWASTSRQFAIVPTQSGAIRFPALHVKWWDMKHKRFHTQTLHAQRFTIAPTAQAASLTPSVTSAPAPLSPSTPKALPTATPTQHPASLIPNNTGFWAAVAMGLLWLLTLTYFLVQKKKGKPSPVTPRVKHSDALEQLKQACQQTNANQIKTYFIQWAKAHFNQPNINGLESIKQHVTHPDLLLQIDILEKKLWSAHDEKYEHGAQLWLAIEDCLNTVPETKSDDDNSKLPPLYR